MDGEPCTWCVTIKFARLAETKAPSASGWGNAMQELLLNSYLAYGSGRSYVPCGSHDFVPSTHPSAASFSTTTHGIGTVPTTLTIMANSSHHEYRYLQSCQVLSLVYSSRSERIWLSSFFTYLPRWCPFAVDDDMGFINAWCTAADHADSD